MYKVIEHINLWLDRFIQGWKPCVSAIITGKPIGCCQYYIMDTSTCVNIWTFRWAAAAHTNIHLFFNKSNESLYYLTSLYL